MAGECHCRGKVDALADSRRSRRRTNNVCPAPVNVRASHAGTRMPPRSASFATTSSQAPTSNRSLMLRILLSIDAHRRRRHLPLALAPPSDAPGARSSRSHSSFPASSFEVSSSIARLAASRSRSLTNGGAALPSRLSRNGPSSVSL